MIFFSAIKKLGINMCNDQKMLKEKFKKKIVKRLNMKWVISMNNGLPPIAPFRQIGNKKRDKIHKDYKY